jgi:hypothetical protein
MAGPLRPRLLLLISISPKSKRQQLNRRQLTSSSLVKVKQSQSEGCCEEQSDDKIIKNDTG